MTGDWDCGKGYWGTWDWGLSLGDWGLQVGDGGMGTSTVRQGTGRLEDLGLGLGD